MIAPKLHDSEIFQIHLLTIQEVAEWAHVHDALTHCPCTRYESLVWARGDNLDMDFYLWFIETFLCQFEKKRGFSH